MKDFVLAALFFFLIVACAHADPSGGNPCLGNDTSSVLQSASGSVSSTTALQAVALATGAQIYVCNLDVAAKSGTTPGFSLVYGTGTNCATGTTVITPTFPVTNGTLYMFSSPVAKVPSGKALCYSASGTTPTQDFFMTYIQK